MVNIHKFAEQAQNDGYIMALTLRTLKSGISTYLLTFEAVQDKYSPFFIPEFEAGFYRGLS